MPESIDTRVSNNLRILSAAMVEKARSGHPGGAMGGADFIHILYSEFLNFDPSDMSWFNRDRFFLDPGHMSPMLYAQLVLFDVLSMEDIKEFRQWQSVTSGHPEINVLKGIENTSGPLGLGHTMAVGAAIAECFLVERFGEWMAHKTYAFISDGGIQEEISQGAGRIAGYLGLSNLIMFYDSNDIQLATPTSAVTAENTAMKYEAWGWRVDTIDGNNHHEIREALKRANEEKNKPTLIIGKTIMGKGALTGDKTSFERQVSTHGQPLTKAGASIEETILNLGGDPDNPFSIFKDVASEYQNIIHKKTEQAHQKKRIQKEWEKNHPDQANELHRFIKMELPELSYESIEIKENQATRNTSSTVLQYFGENINNMIVMSADLANSDKTEGFLKGSKAFGPSDFSGRFFHAGVSELTMAAIANGIALHGGIYVACGTFFVFSDYMKPAIRMAALMELPVKYVWSHDTFRVGEDGPTHQPVEQEAQIRLLEQLKNHSGKNSLLVLRPADGAETICAWRMAMENKDTPTALILSRQNVKDIPAFETGSRYTDACNAYKGAYIVKKDKGTPDLVLVGNGADVGTLLEASILVKKERNMSIQLVSAISEGLFRLQPKEYQEEVLPKKIPVFGLTAGLSITLRGLVNENGYIYGLNHFGNSAPAGVLEEKYGFTAENIKSEILRYLDTHEL